MKTSDFYYDLPPELIAQTPLEKRDESRLLCLDKATGEWSHHHFYELPDFLRAGDCLILNNSRVLPARLLGHRLPGGGACEVLLLQDKGDKVWECLVRPGKHLREGARVSFGDGELTAEIAEVLPDGNRLVRFDYEGIFLEVLERLGKMPLPPYIKEELQDQERYQTVYSKVNGSAAAPTAGLHFTERVLRALDEKGVERNEITLHVGAGTFKPVKSEEIGGHAMHAEWIAVKRESIERLLAHEGHCIAVGTTSVRTLESLYYIGVMIEAQPDAAPDDLQVPQWLPYEYAASGKKQLTARESLELLLDYMTRHELPVLHTATQIIIAPGYEYHIVRGIVTNFHQPQSTLLLLVSALVGNDWRRIYDYALGHDFRFLSYGDSSLLLP